MTAKLEPELDAWIVECLDLRERNHEPFWNIVEREFDLETLLGYFEVPELMLQDDGHFIRVLFHQAIRYRYARAMGVESDIKVMLAGKTGLCNLLQHGTYDAAQRRLRHNIVSDLILSHCPLLTQFT